MCAFNCVRFFLLPLTVQYFHTRKMLKKWGEGVVMGGGGGGLQKYLQYESALNIKKGQGC